MDTLMYWILVTYGILTIAGGFMGYLKAKSLASLIAGSAAGGIVLACAQQFVRGNRLALPAAALVALLLGVRFVRTWSVKRRLMPDLMMVALSFIALAASAVTLAAGR